MRTVKQVSDLTGISIRSLHYYDKIGLFKPSVVTDAGYRLYDDEALETLQQILFFKELDLPLKEVKEILNDPNFDKVKTLNSHKKLLIIKRNRLNELIKLVDQTIKGDKKMSFKEFDMSEYFNSLQKFKQEHMDAVTEYWGSMEKFDEMTENMKAKEQDIAKMAIREFGSIEKYTEAMKKNLSNYSEIMKGFDEIRSNQDYYKSKENELMSKLTSDFTKDPFSDEIQLIIKEIDDFNKETHQLLHMDMGENYWGLMSDFYLTKANFIEAINKKYGEGASEFIGQAFKFYSENKQ